MGLLKGKTVKNGATRKTECKKMLLLEKTHPKIFFQQLDPSQQIKTFWIKRFPQEIFSQVLSNYQITSEVVIIGANHSLLEPEKLLALKLLF